MSASFKPSIVVLRHFGDIYIEFDTELRMLRYRYIFCSNRLTLIVCDVSICNLQLCNVFISLNYWCVDNEQQIYKHKKTYPLSLSRWVFLWLYLFLEAVEAFILLIFNKKYHDI